MMMQYHIDSSTKIIENGSENEIMEKRKTRFNEFGCDKVHHILKEEIFGLMYSTEIYSSKKYYG